mgnify:CR=1 FL=1
MSNREYKIDDRKAEEILQNIFKKAGKTPNDIKFDKLLLQQKAKIGSLQTAHIIATVILVLTIMSPFAFRPALSDTAGPELSGDSLNKGMLAVTVTDSGTGVDYSGIYAEDKDGKVTMPVSVDEDNGQVVFDTDGKELNLFFPDNAGNITHAVFTMKAGAGSN